MGEIRGVVPRDAEEKFRRLAMKKYGYGKGSLSKALEEALCAWIAQCEAEKPQDFKEFSEFFEAATTKILDK